MSFGIKENVDERFVLDLFISSEIAEKYQRDLPFENCEAKCRRGHTENGYCPKCTRPYLLKKILEIPPRYNVEFTSNTFFKNIDMLMSKKFLVLKGSSFYVNLAAFYLAKKYVEKNKMAYHVQTKKFTSYNEVSVLNEETHTDFLALRYADVILYEDICGKITDINYNVFLQKRMNNNMPIIFFNMPENISLKDSNGSILPDIFEFEVDSIGIKILSSEA